MKKVFKGVSFLSLVLITALVLQYVDLKNIQDALAQSSNPRIVRPAETGLEVINRVFSGETPTTTRSTSAEYALPDEEINNAIQVNNSGSVKHGPIQMDMNSDGIQDFVFAKPALSLTTATVGYQYVMLNTGTGYELVYGCKMTKAGLYDPIYYLGDCADHP